MATARIALPTPHPAQRQIIREQKRFNVLCIGRRAGKDLDLRTPVPTPQGWRTIADIQPGDFVFGANGQPTEVLAVQETGLANPCYAVMFDTGETIIAGAGHQWQTLTKLDRQYLHRQPRQKTPPRSGAIHTTEELAVSLWHGHEHNHAIPVAGPVHYPEQNLLVDPYLLGLWLGDGHAANGQLTGADPELFAAFVSQGFPLGKPQGAYTACLLGLQPLLRALGVLNNKHIPRQYIESSITQRIALVQGLMDTDGCALKRGSCEFDNTNKNLAEGMYEILRGLGCKVRWYTKRAKLYGKDCGEVYRLEFKPSFPCFRLVRKHQRQKPPGKNRMRHFVVAVTPVPRVPLKCLQVAAPDGLFLVSHSYIATHNSTLGIDRLVRPALEGWPVAWFAPEDRYYEEIWRDLRHVLAPVITYRNTTMKRLDIAGGGTVELWNVSRPENVARSRKYKLVVVDEAAIIPDLDTAWNKSIQATIADFEGTAWFLSTPKGFNFFHTLWKKGFDADQRIAEAVAAGQDPPVETWKCWQMPSMVNPHMPQSEWDRMKREMTPKDYSQEVLAQFLGEGTAVFPNVQDLATETLKPYNPGHTYGIGVDWARDNDYTVFTVIDVTTKCVVWIQATSKIAFAHQRSLLQGLCDTYHPSLVLVEMNSVGVPNFEVLQTMGLPVAGFWSTNASKVEIVDALILAMARREIRLLDGAQYVDNINVGQTALNELHSYASSKTPSGMVHYGAPKGIHDDYVMSLMLAWMCALSPDKKAFSQEDVRTATATGSSGTWDL